MAAILPADKSHTDKTRKKMKKHNTHARKMCQTDGTTLINAWVEQLNGK